MSRAVYFAASLAAARRAAGRTGDALFASPRRPGALRTALDQSLPVRAVAAARDSSFWRRIAPRFLLPGAPSLLHHAISGIARREEGESHEGATGRLGPTSAHWIEGDLRDRRAAALLDDPDCPRLWIVEDFRKLRISDRMRRRLESERVAIAAYRPLRWVRQKPAPAAGDGRRRSRGRR